MPALQCSARTCVYNKGELCSKGDIKVGGGRATRADETCCESFMERKDTMSNSMTTADTGCGCTTVGISCDAKSCKSNDQLQMHRGRCQYRRNGRLYRKRDLLRQLYVQIRKKRFFAGKSIKGQKLRRDTGSAAGVSLL